MSEALAASGRTCLALSVLANAAAYHAAAQALVTVPPLIAAATAHAIAAAGAAALVVVRRGSWSFAGAAPLTLACAAGAAATGLQFACVAGHGAATTAFLASATPAWLVAAGVARGERLGVGEALAVAALIAGAATLCFGGATPAWAAALLMLPATLLTAVKQLTIAAAGAAKGGLLPTMALTQAMMSAWAAALAVALGQRHLPDVHALSWLAVAGLLGNFAGMALLYAAYARLGVARAATLDALRPVVVLAIGMAIGGATLGGWQLAGAALVVLGSARLLGRRAVPSKGSTPGVAAGGAFGSRPAVAAGDGLRQVT